MHSMSAAAHNLVKGRREVEDHASIFISQQLHYQSRNAYKILSRLKIPLPEVYVRSVGKFVQLHLL